MTAADLRTLVDYHYWAQDRMFESLAPLTEDQFTQPLGEQFHVDSRHGRASVYRRLGLAPPVAGADVDRSSEVTTMLRQLGVGVTKSQDMVIFNKERTAPLASL